MRSVSIPEMTKGQPRRARDTLSWYGQRVKARCHRALAGTCGRELAWGGAAERGEPGSELAEDKRFELLRGCPQHAFQACAIGH
jgi:hypothetical protein